MSRHFVLNPVGSHGDVHPFVGIGVELRRRGHRVTIATNGHFESLALAAGLEFVEVGGTDADFRRIAGNPNLWHPTRGPRTAMREGAVLFLESSVKTLRSLVTGSADGTTAIAGTTLVTSSLGIASRTVRDIVNVPMATLHLAPVCFRSVTRPPVLFGARWPRNILLRRLMWWLMDVAVIDPIVTRQLNRYRKTIGLPKVRRLLNEWWHSPDCIIGLFPGWFGDPQPDWPLRTVLTNFPLFDEAGLTALPEPLEQFLHAGDAPIAFTPGSAMVRGEDFFTTAVEACVKLNRRGVLLTRHGDQVPQNLPASIIHTPYAPFSQLLPRSCAIVHHGGIGTTSQGLAAGVPQVVMAMSHDQPDNASRLVDLGVGAMLLRKNFTTVNLVPVLQRLLNGTAANRAKQIASTMSHAGISQTADVLEALTIRD